MLWCAFDKVFDTQYPKDTVLDLLRQNNWYSMVPNLRCVDAERLIFQICKNNKLATDSFQPVFRLSVQDARISSVVRVRISAKPSTQIIFGLYSIVCALFQVAMLKMYCSNELNFSFVLFLPFFLFLFSQVLTHFALRISARRFLKTLSNLVCSST